ncbi:hypothetical protein [Cupriavidus basilensis]|uniref:hypothetical protein n=1 Tax=Cupriavidus basilensis TaxID=68895 RepID=UPI0020A63220|nr:hypothetical protein [Cupriavidus basilensis]MCP3018382.1 hypothetical protein [Cupriavidus basilensis]
MPLRRLRGRFFGQGGAVLLLALLTNPQAASQEVDVLEQLEDPGRAGPAAALGAVFQFRGIASKPEGQERTAYASTSTLRLTYEATYGAIRWVAHLNMEDVRASQAAALQSLVDGQAHADRLRGLALRERGDRSQQTAGMDWMYAQGNFASGRYTVGRQPISPSLTRLWAPADTYAPFLPGDVERLYKPGVDAARLDYYLSDRLNSVSIVSLDQDAKSGTQAKWLQRLEFNGEATKSFAYVGQRRNCDLLAAGHLVTGLAGADWYGEALVFRRNGDAARGCTNQDGDTTRNWGHRAVLGSSVKLAANTVGTVEYLHQTPISRFADLPWMGTGRQYLGTSVSYQAHPLVHLDALWFANLSDRGQQLTLAARYTPQRNVVLRANLAAPLTGTGRRHGVASEYWRMGRVFQLGLDWYF